MCSGAWTIWRTRFRRFVSKSWPRGSAHTVADKVDAHSCLDRCDCSSEGGVPYIMRPEFILNFVALAPKAADVRKSLADLLPTTAGLQLGPHLQPDVMHSLLRDAAEWARITPERVSVLMSDKVNRLKHDRFKQYTQKLA